GRADLAIRPVDQAVDELRDIAELLFGDLDQREIADRAIGSAEQEEIGKVGHGDRQIGLRTVGPDLVEIDAAAAEYPGRADEAIDLKAGREDEHVEIVKHAVGGAHAIGLYPRDRRRDQIGIGLLD